MGRLIAFGCSYTYGHALTDCFIPPYNAGYEPSKLAYPQLIADKLNFECVNKGQCGASNKEIWYNAVNFNYNSGDTIILHWTFPDRTAIINDDESIQLLAPWNDNELSGTYYKHFHTETNTNIEFCMMFNHINFLLHRRGFSAINLKPSKNLYKDLPGWNEFNILDIHLDTLSKEYNSIALDENHPGDLAHEKFAEQLLERF
jgi:hypothetical protein